MNIQFFCMKIFGASAWFNYAWLVSLSNHSNRTLSDTFRKSLREKSNKQQQIKQNILFERFEHILVDFCPQDTNLYPVLRLRSATENSPTNARDAENIKNRHAVLRLRSATEPKGNFIFSLTLRLHCIALGW